jgi:hypothetical protein
MAWPTSVATDADLYVVVNNLQDFLSGSITSGDTTVTLADATDFPATGGYVSVEQEIIKYAAKSGNQLTGCTRGADGTSAAAHAGATPVFMYWVADHHNKLKNELIAIETDMEDRLGFNAANKQILADSGIGGLTNPTYSFQTDDNTGIVRFGSDQMSLVAGGQESARVVAGNQFALNDGSLAVPGLTFISDLNTGLYRQGGDAFGLSVGGLEAIRVLATGGLAVARFGNGVNSTPSISFIGDPDTGFYSIGSNEIQFACGGANVAVLRSNGNFQASTFTAGTGSAAVPSYSSATNSGVFFPTTNLVALSAGGVEVLRGNASGQTLHADGTASLPAMSFNADPDLGFYRVGANSIGLGAGTTEVFRAGTSGLLMFNRTGAAQTAQMVLVNAQFSSASLLDFYDGSTTAQRAAEFGVAFVRPHTSGTPDLGPVYAFFDDSDTGLGRPSTADILDVWTGGSSVSRFNATGLQVGASLTAPTSSLTVNGSFARAYVAKTGAYSATISDSVITGDATGGAFSITLPTAVGITGRLYTIKKIDASVNAVTVATTSSQTIDGATTKALTLQHSAITVQSNGSNWHILSGHINATTY